MKKLIIPFIALSLSSSCSHLSKDPSQVPKDYSRSLASQDGSCFSVFGEVYDETSFSHKALNRLTKLEEELIANPSSEKQLEVEEYLTDLRGKVLSYESPTLQDSWMSMMSTFQQYKYSGSSFDSFRSNWNQYKKDFFNHWRNTEKEDLIKASEQVSKIEEEAEAVVKELKTEEIEAIEMVNKRSSIIQGLWAKAQNADDEISQDELKEFTYWVFAKADFESLDGDHIYDNINLWLKEYREVAKHMSKSTRKQMVTDGKKNLLTLHNQVTKKFVDDLVDADELKKQSLIYIQLFSLLEPRFNKDGFTKYLFDEEFFSEESLQYYRGIRKAEGIDVDLGMILRDQYQKFAPYQDRPPVVNKSFAEVTIERTRDLWDKLSKGQKSCADLDCYNKQARNGWLEIFKLRSYKKAFSCLGNNPVVLKSMVMDLGIMWGGLTWFYYQNPESFQRFPIEIMINGAAFAPVMAEANCRASFKGDLAFGTQIPEKEVITNALTKTNRVFGKLKGVALKGFFSSVGLLSLTTGFDHLFMALGHKVVTPLSINDMAALLPISFLYHGVWLGVKNMAVINPIRHKVIPRLANALAKKTGLSKAYWPLQTGLDFGAYHAFATLGKWDYLVFYSAVLLPFIKDHFAVGNDLEHKEELIREDVVEHTYTGTSDTGVKTEVVIIEDKNGIAEAGVVDGTNEAPIGDEMPVSTPRGTVEVKSVEVEVPDNVIDSWADSILSGLPQD
tara:strand:+ start:148564 stop:150750 length:2187 start_codon:yes stop_codon:yes gene_type:complete